MIATLKSQTEAKYDDGVVDDQFRSLVHFVPKARSQFTSFYF
jgi:hypothetical protein